MKTGEFVNERSDTALIFFVLSNYLYLGIVLSTSLAKPFRKPFYTNYFYTANLIFLWCYNTLIVFVPQLAPTTVRHSDLHPQTESMLVLALVCGNLFMMLMFLYEHLATWVYSKLMEVKNNSKLIESLEMYSQKM